MERGCAAACLPWEKTGAHTGWAIAGGKNGSFAGISIFLDLVPLAQGELVACMSVPGGDNLRLISSPESVISSILPAPSLAALSFSKCKSAEIFFFSAK